MRISDWSSDVCSSDLIDRCGTARPIAAARVRNGPAFASLVRAADPDRMVRARANDGAGRAGMNETTYLSGYRLMWIFVMFDLPVGTKKQMHDATKFREFLLDQGFEMSQFSVYARFCNGKDSFDSHLGRIRSEEHTSELQSLMRI